MSEKQRARHLIKTLLDFFHLRQVTKRWSYVFFSSANSLSFFHPGIMFSFLSGYYVPRRSVCASDVFVGSEKRASVCE